MKRALTASLALCLPLVLAGCQPLQDMSATAIRPAPRVAKAPTRTSPSTTDVIVKSGQDDPGTRHVFLQVVPANPMATGENVIDTATRTGIANYVAARFSRDFVQSVTLIYPDHRVTFPLSQSPVAPMIGPASSPIPIPPPGVTMDPDVRPLAGPAALPQTKFHALMSVADSKLGTPYIWGHNEDRGQYGFDCSNFTSYVYDHALGYKFSGSSQVQYHSVGVPVARQAMQPGDLLVFLHGAHVGIYIGHEEMIEEGGGLGHVGFLSIGPGSYWGKHLTVVKRMY
ncbi:MAG: NlpC/P60 family protein [Firmicutes bacterium]|nr:NlpC/P60 family protein [Bacillota bacterium]